MHISPSLVIALLLVLPFLALGVVYFFLRKTKYGRCFFIAGHILFFSWNMLFFSYFALRKIYINYGSIFAIVADVVGISYLFWCFSAKKQRKKRGLAKEKFGPVRPVKVANSCEYESRSSNSEP